MGPLYVEIVFIINKNKQFKHCWERSNCSSGNTYFIFNLAQNREWNLMVQQWILFYIEIAENCENEQNLIESNY